MKIKSGSNYTMYIPDHPTRMVIYFNAHIAFPTSNGRKSRTKYNFREEVCDAIYDEKTIVFAGLYSKKILEIIIQNTISYSIEETIVSGWSVGGNDAITVAASLVNKVPMIKVLLIDSNHTNNITDGVFKKLKSIEISNVSNNLNKTKIKKLEKVLNTGLFKDYLLLSLPKDFKGSHHRYCRDSTLNNHLYNYVFGGPLDQSKYKVYKWDPKKKEMILNGRS